MEPYNLQENIREQGSSKADDNEILNKVDGIIKELIDVLSPFNQVEINIVPFKGSWTAAQVGEHLLKSYGVVETLNGAVKPTERKPDQKFDEIEEVFLNFSIKMDSPDFIIPSNDTINKETLISSLQSKRSLINQVIQTKDLSMTCLEFALPGLGELTRLEWIHFVNCHTQRHVRQLRNISDIVLKN